ncbi:nuclear protein localization protein 4 [Blastocladiella emersonii ATCC 22665]|nr:nuclear protein localization protein 4 [Blastocladiella emersonii ATCC 22665]
MPNIVIRLRTRDGMQRCSLPDTADVGELWGQTAALVKRNEFGLKSERGALPRGGASLGQLGLKHGDIVMVDYEAAPQPAPEAASAAPDSAARSNGFDASAADAIDVALAKESGLIKRGKDPRFCRHGEKGMCDYCSPLEPYDAKYMEENKIKHLSFHAYLRKLTAASTRQSGAAMVHPLSETSCKVQVPCGNSHAPWPEGICSKCQPSAVSLKRQEFRMVDHVEFETPDLIDSLLAFWRTSGLQRFAYMYGRFEPYPKVPLGIKAVVAALYEPPQSNASDGLALDYVPGTPDGDNADARLALENADRAAAACGLVCLGMIVTDLIDDGTNSGKVQYKRHDKSFFLTSVEVQLAAHMQRQHPTRTPYSSSGTFGSRFVTCVVSGNAEGGIEIEAYQVSETATALVDAGIVEPSTVPSMMLVREPTSTLYVPDIMYQSRNEYGAVVSHRAAPAFPVDYLLVNVTHGFPASPAPTFPAAAAYPVANRIASPQTPEALARFVTAAGDTNKPDFNFVEHVFRTGILAPEQAAELARATVLGDGGAAVRHTQAWNTLRTLLASMAPAPAPSAPSSFGGGNSGAGSAPAPAPAAQQSWSCPHCTFTNSGSVVDCEMCGLPK